MTDTTNTSATRATRMRRECYMNDTSLTRVLQERHECYTSENFDFYNDTSESICSHPYISYMANERLQGEKQFYSKNYLLEMPRSHAKVHFKSAPYKLNFVMAKDISKSYGLDWRCKCPSTFPHSYA